VLNIKLGEEQRQIVAGIRAFYELDELKGKMIVVVSNLESATIRGVESQGMLLAAHEGDSLTLVTPEREIAAGASIR